MNVMTDFGPKPRLGYADSRIDRRADRRTDDAFLAELWHKTECVTYVISGELIALKQSSSQSHDPVFLPQEALTFTPVTETIFLGMLDGSGRFAIGIEATAMEALRQREDILVTDLRSIAVQGLVGHDHLPPMAEGKALLHWHMRHRFCANCGHPTHSTQNGWRRDCPQCKAQHFPRTDPVAIMLAVDGDRCLLGRQPHFVAGSWSCLAGFIEPGEAIEDAVRREIQEEAGIACGRVRYFRSQPWPFPSSLMIGCHTEAISRDITVDYQELEDARWFSREDVALMLMRKHPAGLITPPPVAIAYHIIREWVENGDDVLA